MAGRRREKLHTVVDRAAFGIGGAVIEPADTGECDRAGAHGAGLERDIEVAIVEAFGVQPVRRLTDGDHFGMGGQIPLGERAIAGTHDDLAVTHNDATDRHLAAVTGGAGFCQGHIHERGHFRHDRAMTRPSTSLSVAVYKDLDARHKLALGAAGGRTRVAGHNSTEGK